MNDCEGCGDNTSMSLEEGTIKLQTTLMRKMQKMYCTGKFVDVPLSEKLEGFVADDMPEVLMPNKRLLFV